MDTYSQTKIKSIISNLIGKPIISIKNIGEGRNSKVYHITTKDSKECVAKLYFQHDNRNRMQEFSNLQFLWNNGITCIPKPIALDIGNKCAIYEYIMGKKLNKIVKSDVDYAIQFLSNINKLKTKKESKNLPIASDACFSIQDILDIIERRLNNLQKIPKNNNINKRLHEFIKNKFMPSFNNILNQTKLIIDKENISQTSEIEQEERILSPSDFGFHNAIRKDNDQVIFVDFEYFGWDDPAKLISDFLLHPGMNLNNNLKKRFVENLFKTTFKDQENLKKRLKIVYPLFGLIWCLILLNEFIPEHIQRRKFASKEDYIDEKVQLIQLSKKKTLLQKINKEQVFPYFT